MTAKDALGNWPKLDERDKAIALAEIVLKWKLRRYSTDEAVDVMREKAGQPDLLYSDTEELSPWIITGAVIDQMHKEGLSYSLETQSESGATISRATLSDRARSQDIVSLSLTMHEAVAIAALQVRAGES